MEWLYIDSRLNSILSSLAAYMEQHHQLPDDEWSSDTECEQKPLDEGSGEQNIFSCSYGGQQNANVKDVSLLSGSQAGW